MASASRSRASRRATSGRQFRHSRGRHRRRPDSRPQRGRHSGVRHQRQRDHHQRQHATRWHRLHDAGPAGLQFPGRERSPVRLAAGSERLHDGHLGRRGRHSPRLCREGRRHFERQRTDRRPQRGGHLRHRDRLGCERPGRRYRQPRRRARLGRRRRHRRRRHQRKRLINNTLGTIYGSGSGGNGFNEDGFFFGDGDGILLGTFPATSISATAAA